MQCEQRARLWSNGYRANSPESSGSGGPQDGGLLRLVLVVIVAAIATLPVGAVPLGRGLGDLVPRLR